ncbi:rhodanese-like domain-containing protein [Mesorhizobium muleiense]|uniref:rhodanese-like domain-containing protein n=1 Tax=Mesorhizobium muleiense TaxID=1004279 RepID=UPI003AFB35D6
MTSSVGIDARALKRALSDGDEIALLDVREAGEFAAGHPFLASSAAFSRFEVLLTRLVPRRNCRVVLYDDGLSGRAEHAADLGRRLGYGDMRVLIGGARGWAEAGFTLFEGVFVPSKAFGELVEQAFEVPHITPAALQKRIQRGDALVIVDGRPFNEHTKMNVPGSICVPNGELAYRAEFFVPDEETPVVVHCAGRTRSILGAQILRDMGIRNPVFALENGTQGWRLAGLELERGSSRRVEAVPGLQALGAMTMQARALAERWNVAFARASDVNAWGRDETRTTYVFDVRSDLEFAAEHLDCAENAPGGQLIQSTDVWAAVRGARIVLIDDNEMRAVVVARWLRLMGWEVYALAGGQAAWPDIDVATSPVIVPSAVRNLESALIGKELLLDTQPSMSFRAGHISGARWTLRSHLADTVRDVEIGRPIVLCGGDAVVDGLIASDLRNMGYADIRALKGDPAAWKAAGLPVVSTPDEPPDEEAIDFVFFTHDRHSGNLEAARQYIAWETGLVARLDAQERAVFAL